MVKYNSSKLKNLKDEPDIPETDSPINTDKLCVNIKDIFRQELTDYFNKHNDSKGTTINGISFEEYIERVSNAYETSVKTNNNLLKVYSDFFNHYEALSGNILQVNEQLKLIIGYLEKPKVRKIQFSNFPSKFSILFQYIFYYIPLFCIKWLYYSKPARQFSLIVAVCIWFFSLCFTGFLLYDNAKLSLENEKNMLIRKTLGTDKKNRKQIMYIDLLYSHKEYYEDEILRLLEKSINDN